MQVSISSQCASALDNLAGFYFKHFVAAEDGPSTLGQVAPGLSHGWISAVFLQTTWLLDCYSLGSLVACCSPVLAGVGGHTRASLAAFISMC